MQISITLKPEARAQARAALELRGIPVADDWLGPVFENAVVLVEHPIIGLMFGIRVNSELEPEYYYPYSDIARIKIV